MRSFTSLSRASVPRGLGAVVVTKGSSRSLEDQVGSQSEPDAVSVVTLCLKMTQKLSLNQV